MTRTSRHKHSSSSRDIILLRLLEYNVIAYWNDKKVMNYITEDNIRSVDGGIIVFIMDYEVIV